MLHINSQFWRVENEKGVGPFTSRTGVYAEMLYILDRHNISHYEIWPLPSVDPFLKPHFNNSSFSPDYVFGMKTLRDYKAMFPHRELQACLHDYGFYLVQYTSPKPALQGVGQIAFDRRFAVPVAYRRCNSPRIFQASQMQIKPFPVPQNILT